MSVKYFEDLEVWQLARKLTNEIYNIKFSGDWSMANQIRRAAVSVMSNIAEGFERNGNQEFLQFLYIAKGSCGEVRCQLYIIQDQGYIKDDQFVHLSQLAKTISMKLMGLIRHLKASRLSGIKYKINNPEISYQEDLQKIFNEVTNRTSTV